MGNIIHQDVGVIYINKDLSDQDKSNHQLGSKGLDSFTVRRTPISQIVSEYRQYRNDHRPEASTPCKYPVQAGTYMRWCLTHGLELNGISFDRYLTMMEKRGSNVRRIKCMLKNFMLWNGHETRQYIPGPELTSTILPPSNNTLVLLFIYSLQNHAQPTKLMYLSALNRYFEYIQRFSYAFDEYSVRQFKEDLIENRLVKKQLLKEYKDVPRKFSSFTINAYLSAIRSLVQFILDDNTRLPHPYQFTDKQKEQLQRILLVKGFKLTKMHVKQSIRTNERLQQVFEQADNPTELAALQLQGICGLRAIELTRLSLQNLDFTYNRLHVIHKGGKNNVVVLFKECHKALQEHIDTLEFKAADDALFPGWSTRRLRNLANRCYRALHMKSRVMTGHSLRHTAARNLLENGFTPAQVQHQLGHESYETTLWYVREKEKEMLMQREYAYRPNSDS